MRAPAVWVHPSRGMGASFPRHGCAPQRYGCIDVAGGRVDVVRRCIHAVGRMHTYRRKDAPIPQGRAPIPRERCAHPAGACAHTVGRTRPYHGKDAPMRREECAHTAGRMRPYRGRMHPCRGKDAPMRREECTHPTAWVRGWCGIDATIHMHAAPIPQHGRVPPAGASRHATGSARACPLIPVEMPLNAVILRPQAEGPHMDRSRAMFRRVLRSLRSLRMTPGGCCSHLDGSEPDVVGRGCRCRVRSISVARARTTLRSTPSGTRS